MELLLIGLILWFLVPAAFGILAFASEDTRFLIGAYLSAIIGIITTIYAGVSVLVEVLK